MPRARKKRSVNLWTAADLKTLLRHARRKSAAGIARELNRSESAVRQKACALGVSLQLS
jgi:hypothetical protein